MSTIKFCLFHVVPERSSIRALYSDPLPAPDAIERLRKWVAEDEETRSGAKILVHQMRTLFPGIAEEDIRLESAGELLENPAKLATCGITTDAT